MLAKLPAVRQTLLNAADLIEERGLMKGQYCENLDGSGSLCVRGAIRVIAGMSLSDFYVTEPPGVVEAESMMTDYLIHNKGFIPGPWMANHPDRTSGACADWNNEDERTKEEVVDALRAAALHGL